MLLFLLVVFALSAGAFGDPLYQDYQHGISEDFTPVGINSPGFPLGADTLGRNVLPRLAYGTRTSLIVAVVANVTSLALSLVVALAAGFYRGNVESVLMRITDVALALPGLLAALVLAAFIPGGMTRVIVITTILFWAYPARLFYGQVLRLRSRGFVEAAEAAGARGSTTMFRHILPHLMPLVLTYSALNTAAAVLFESTLSFIGAGIDPPTASLGRMIAENEASLSYAPHLLIAPAILILLITMALLLLGEGLKARNPGVARVSWLGA